MSAAVETREQAPAGYRFVRGLVRIGLSLFSKTLRLLNLEVMSDAGAAVLVVAHPAEWRDVLRLVAAFPWPLRCLVPDALLCNSWRRGMARALGMIPYAAGAAAWVRITDRCCEALENQELVVAFAGTRDEDPHIFARNLAGIASEAETHHAGQMGASLFTIHWLTPQAGAPATETLIHIDGPLMVRDYLPADEGEGASGVEALAAALERQNREHVFCPQPEVVARFRESLEAALKADLEDAWSARAGGKQTADGLQLNAHVSRWVEEASYGNPGQIMALWDLLDRCREERRRWALSQLEAEMAGAWLASPWRRVAAWTETLAGLPLAAYGFINHLVIGVLLLGTGWFRRKGNTDRAATWVMAGLGALTIYVFQIFLVAKLAGRAAAGYYAPSLPISAAYLWRYRWLLQHRTRPLFVFLRMPRQAAIERRRRKAVIACFERAFRRFADAANEKM